MEHAQPLSRSFPWRGLLLAVALVLVIALAGVAGLFLVHRLEGTHRAAATGHVQRSQATSRPTAPATPLRPRSRVSVLVLNGNGTSGAAGAEATRLLGRGYRHALAADAPDHEYARTLVLFRPGWEREAKRLARDARGGLVAPLDGRLPSTDAGYQLVLVLGAS